MIKMSMIDSLKSILTNLETEIASALDDYSILRFMREPDRLDRYPAIMIVPTEVAPIYQTMTEDNEQGLFLIDIYQIIRVGFDYKGSKLLDELDTLLDHLFTIRHDKTKWRDLDYKEGIAYEYMGIDNAMLQSAVIHLKIKK